MKSSCAVTHIQSRNRCGVIDSCSDVVSIVRLSTIHVWHAMLLSSFSGVKDNSMRCVRSPTQFTELCSR